MDYKEFKIKLKEINMSVKEFMLLVGMNPTTASARWVDNVPPWVPKFIEGLEHKIELDKFKEICKETK